MKSQIKRCFYFNPVPPPPPCGVRTLLQEEQKRRRCPIKSRMKPWRHDGRGRTAPSLTFWVSFPIHYQFRDLMCHTRRAAVTDAVPWASRWAASQAAAAAACDFQNSFVTLWTHNPSDKLLSLLWTVPCQPSSPQWPCSGLWADSECTTHERGFPPHKH